MASAPIQAFLAQALALASPHQPFQTFTLSACRPGAQSLVPGAVPISALGPRPDIRRNRSPARPWIDSKRGAHFRPRPFAPIRGPRCRQAAPAVDERRDGQSSSGGR